MKCKKVLEVIAGIIPLLVLAYAVYKWFESILSSGGWYIQTLHQIRDYNEFLGTIAFVTPYLLSLVIVYGSLYYTYKIFRDED